MLGDGVDVGCLNEVRAVAAQKVPPKLVGEQEHDVRSVQASSFRLTDKAGPGLVAKSESISHEALGPSASYQALPKGHFIPVKLHQVVRLLEIEPPGLGMLV